MPVPQSQSSSTRKLAAQLVKKQSIQPLLDQEKAFFDLASPIMQGRKKTATSTGQTAAYLQSGVKCVSSVLADAHIALDESESLREMFILNCKLEILLKHAIKTHPEVA